jgi:predicted dehydrogenase
MTTKNGNKRRAFLTQAAVLAAAAPATANATGLTPARASESNARGKTVRVGIMGLSRGMALAKDLAKIDGVEIAYLCDVDSRRRDSGVQVFQNSKQSPKGIDDVQILLQDASVDALVCAAPNHWHGPATVMALNAGKHVYVEKPCSHNAQEGEWMVQAAEQTGLCVQMGTQRRSSPGTQAAMQLLHSGKIGTVLSSRCYYTNLRGSIGSGVNKPVPDWLDYDLWQGPVPRRPFQDNLVHYNWHWFWHYGGGELANNGVHALDLCRWGLGVDYPTQVISSGGRYWYEDDQETPDAQTACFEFESGKRITWQAHSCNKHGVNAFCEFFGDDGSLELDADGKFRVYSRTGKLLQESSDASSGQPEHLRNFVNCVRSGKPGELNQPILEGHKSTLLCHLGNIAYRTGKTVNCGDKGHILVDEQQQDLWGRDYDPQWSQRVRPTA